MVRQQTQLFEQYPLDNDILLDGERVSSPYHVYDGTMLMIGGTADATAVKALLKNEDCVPVLDSAGRALMIAWVCDFTEANLGAHGELQFAFLATKNPQAHGVKSHPFSVLNALINDGSIFCVCHGLWNNTQTVVAYNSQHLKLNARQSSGTLAQHAAGYTFKLVDNVSQQLLIEGCLQKYVRPSLKTMFSLMMCIGLKKAIKLMTAPWFEASVMNIKSAYAEKNYLAKTATQSSKQLVRLFNAEDQLIIHDPTYAQLDFSPQFVEQIEQVKFVYLRPEVI